MPIKAIRINLSIIPARISKIMDAGRQNRLHNTDGSLQRASICTKIVYFFLEVQNDPEVKSYLQESGGTLIDLILRAVKMYIKTKR